MEYVHSALLLHAADQEINEENVTNVLEAAGVDVDSARVKSLVAALDGVDIDEAMNTAVAGGSAATGGSTADEAESEDEVEEEEDTEEPEPDEDTSSEDAEEGLGDLF